MKIEKHSVVSIEYTLTNNEGNVIDTSENGEPLSYLHGTGSLIPGLEKELEGKKLGDSFKLSIPPEEGYGQRNEQQISEIPKSEFRGVETFEKGMQFQTHSEHGVQVVTVIDIVGDNVTVDGNHPLAGETLNFDVSIVSVRKALPEELTHGHAHGPGGAHH